MLKQTLNKGISTPIAIGIVLILAILVGSFTWWQYSEIFREENEIVEIEKPKNNLEIKEETLCEKLRQEVDAEFDKLNYCDDNSDCNQVGSSEMEQNCYRYINKETVPLYSGGKEANEKLREYYDKCSKEFDICDSKKVEAGGCLYGKCFPMNELIEEYKNVDWRIRPVEIIGFEIEIDGKIYIEAGRIVKDLNGDGKVEIIVNLSSKDWASNNYVYVFALLNDDKEYIELGRVDSADILRIRKTEDINGDDIKEIFLYWPGGGTTAREIYKILDIDFDGKKLNWMKFQAGKIEDNTLEEFGYRGRCVFQAYIFNKDIDKDNTKEIVGFNAAPCDFTGGDACPCYALCEEGCKEFEKEHQVYGDEWFDCVEECNQKYEEDFKGKNPCQSCELSVYEWNGTSFLYSEELSKRAEEDIKIDEFSSIVCNVCIGWK